MDQSDLLWYRMAAWVDDINTGARVLSDIIRMTPEGAQQSVYKTSCVITLNFYVTLCIGLLGVKFGCTSTSNTS